MMHSSSTTQRKNKPRTGVASPIRASSSSAITTAATSGGGGGGGEGESLSLSSSSSQQLIAPASTSPAIATVKRRKFGTSPFDEHWLNLDCCGLICAAFTYLLHLYGCYAVCFILIPPWMSYVGDDGTRHLTIWGHANRVAFCAVAVMAVISHLKAMMTDPGAVPPDARPLPLPEELESLTENNRGSSHHYHDSNNNKPHEPLGLNNHNGDGRGGVGGVSDSLSKPSLGGMSMENSNINASAADASSGNIGSGNSSALQSAAVVAGAGAAAAVAAVSAAMPSKPPPNSPFLAGRGGPGGGGGTRKLCRRCNTFKPKRAHHCSICKRCIIKMDHHCPWVNNCVGIGNHKFFLLFIFYTFISCAYSMTLVVWRFWMCMRANSLINRHSHCLDEPTHMLNIVGLLVEALLFGLFTSCMMIDQWDVVMTNVTHIDRLKGETHFYLGGERSDSGINEVFGTGMSRRGRDGFRPDWLSPFVKVCFPASLKDEIMGFCRPCGYGKSSSQLSDVDVEMSGVGGGRISRSVAEIV